MNRFWTLTMTALLTCSLLVGCGGGGGDEEQEAGEGAGAPAGPAGPAGPAAAGQVSSAKVDAALKKAVEFVLARQNPDGGFGEPPNFSPNVGITGLTLVSLVESGQVNKDDEAVKDAVAFILRHKKPDGSIYANEGYNSYETSLAVVALAAVDREAHQDAIKAAADWLISIQDDGSKNPLSTGGIGYGNDKTQSNLSTTGHALMALKAAGVPEDSEAWKRAVAFVAACQNDAEVNKLGYAAVVNDGGFIYTPQESKAGSVEIRGRKGWRSYGSMTYLGYLSYAYAKLDKDDPRVKGAERWITQKGNYTLDENPQMGGQGQFYYYHVFALAMEARGEPTLKTSDGVEHDWSRELAAKLLSLQKADGSWENLEDRWHEGSPTLVTAYALRALSRAGQGVKQGRHGAR